MPRASSPIRPPSRVGSRRLSLFTRSNERRTTASMAPSGGAQSTGRRRNGEVLFFIIPDLLYARGTLVRWAERFVEGKKAIFTVRPEVVLESVVPERRSGSRARKPFRLDRDQLVDLLGRHLHPLHAAMRHDARRRPPSRVRTAPRARARNGHSRDRPHPFCVTISFYSALNTTAPRTTSTP